MEENNYYPFGLKHKGYNANINGRHHKYMFGGKELQDDIVGSSSFEVYDFGARNYDQALGRWMNLDPLAEQMRRHSPYNYAFNNPIYFIDPDGMAPQGPGPISPLGPAPIATIIVKNWDNLKNSWNKLVDNISKFESSFGGAQGNSKKGDNSIQRKTKDDITTYEADVIINSAPSGNGKNLKGNGLENSVKKITNNITKLKAAGEKINKVNEGLEIAGKSVDQATEAISEITERFPSRVEVTNNDNGGETKIGILKDSTVSLPESQHADFKKSAKEARESIFERMPNN